MISFVLLAFIKGHELKSIHPFYKMQPVPGLAHFKAAQSGLGSQEVELLELWESMLTGRTAPVSRWIKEQYKGLGLNHLFTPSGFHLSAVLMPLMKLIKNARWQLLVLLLIGTGLLTVAGQGALKRMVLIKVSQKFLEHKTGFVVALMLDMLVGTFADSPLSFCYSFLFLGIIYSGSLFLFLWFFFAQAMIAYFNGEMISPLILLLSPLLNLAFALSMPVLLLLSFPLWGWQLAIGLKILAGLQWLVNLSASLSASVPHWEVNVGILICFTLFYYGKRKALALVLLFLSFNLDIESKKLPSFGRFEFVPQGELIKIVSNDVEEKLYFSDGICKRELIRGIWWEKCSPRRKSTRKKKLLKKLSYL